MGVPVKRAHSTTVQKEGLPLRLLCHVFHLQWPSCAEGSCGSWAGHRGHDGRRRRRSRGHPAAEGNPVTLQLYFHGPSSHSDESPAANWAI